MTERTFTASPAGTRLAGGLSAAVGLASLAVAAAWSPAIGWTAAITAFAAAIYLLARRPLRVVVSDALVVEEAGKTWRFAWTDVERVGRGPDGRGLAIVLRTPTTDQRRRRALLGADVIFIGPGLDVDGVITAIDARLSG